MKVPGHPFLIEFLQIESNFYFHLFYFAIFIKKKLHLFIVFFLFIWFEFIFYSINSVERSKLRNSIDEEENENDLQSNPPQFEPHPSQDDFQLKERTNFSESAFDIYERKVKNILTSLYNYNPPEEPNLNDFALLKRNYDLLMTLFQVFKKKKNHLLFNLVKLLLQTKFIKNKYRKEKK